MPRFIDNWKQVAVKAWSSRLAWAAALLSAAEVSLPFFEGVLPVSKGTFAILALLASTGAAIARIVAQPETLPATPVRAPSNGS